MPRSRLLVAVVLACALVAPVLAQTVAPLALLKMIQVASLRLDTLQHRVDRTAFNGQVFAYAHIDEIDEPLSGVVHVAGWGFGCGYPDSRIVFVVDDIETANGSFRVARADVNAAYAGVCNVQGLTGIDGLIDVTPFEPGFSGNHQHTFKIRVYPPSWPSQVPFAAADSAPVTFTTY